MDNMAAFEIEKINATGHNPNTRGSRDFAGHHPMIWAREER